MKKLMIALALMASIGGIPVAHAVDWHDVYEGVQVDWDSVQLRGTISTARMRVGESNPRKAVFDCEKRTIGFGSKLPGSPGTEYDDLLDFVCNKWNSTAEAVPSPAEAVPAAPRSVAPPPAGSPSQETRPVSLAEAKAASDAAMRAAGFTPVEVEPIDRTEIGQQASKPINMGKVFGTGLLNVFLASIAAFLVFKVLRPASIGSPLLIGRWWMAVGVAYGVWDLGPKTIRTGSVDEIAKLIVVSLGLGLVGFIVGLIIAKVNARRKAAKATQAVGGEAIVSSQPARGTSDSVYDQIGMELESGQTNRATWVRAQAEADGHEAKARSIYIRLRAMQLSSNAPSPIETARSPFGGAGTPTDPGRSTSMPVTTSRLYSGRDDQLRDAIVAWNQRASES